MAGIKNGEYTLTYKNMAGVDFSAPSGTRKRYAYIENMYRDYDGEDADSLESIPGFRKLKSFGEAIHGIYFQTSISGIEYTIVHAGKSLYRFPTARRNAISNSHFIAEVSDDKGTAFSLGHDFFFFNQSTALRIDGKGTVTEVMTNNETTFVPTTYYNGSRFEQENILTNRFKEKYIIGAAETVTYGTHDLLYSVIDEEKKLCAVVGISPSFLGGIVNVPSYKRIGGKTYKVYEIADNAFLENPYIFALRIGIGVYRIGKYALKGCASLLQLFCPDSLGIIDTGAFQNCTRLSNVYLGLGIEKFGSAITDGCKGLSVINYASDLADFQKIENHSYFDKNTVQTMNYNLSFAAEIPIFTPTANITSVKFGGEEFTEYEVLTEGEKIVGILFTVEDRRTIEGKEIIIEAEKLEQEDEEGSAYGVLKKIGYKAGGFCAVTGCTVSEKFDGRIFLSGNSSLPGMVFFSARETDDKDNTLYFGAYNYFCDGLGGHGIRTMLASADSLAVFKKADDGGGSIFYHTAKETEDDFIPKVYPVSYTHNGIGAIGGSIAFFDDPIFISKTGICALDKKSINLERSIACRSHNVNSRLLSENLEDVSLAEWCGYLAVGVNGHIYLADSRAAFLHDSGSREYEWYYLTDIGTYENSTRVYRYASIAPNGYKVFDEPEKIVTAEIKSIRTGSSYTYYTEENGEKYAVYPTEEMQGGTFHPLITLASTTDDLLFFGTDNGDLCIFNNDKRGQPPTRLSDSPDFNMAEYTKIYGRRIHPDFYSFDGHAMRCGVRTVKDDCGIPSLTKNTVKHSLTLKCRIGGAGRIRCEAATNRSGYSELSALPNNAPDFSDWSFDTLTLDSEETVSLPIEEKEKNWIDKELSVYCDDFCSPIGIYSLSYRFTVKGRIKHN